MKGLSARNVWRMKQFYLAYANEYAKLPQAVAEIPWGHNMVLLEKIKDNGTRLWYVQKTVENGWSRNVLTHQIATDLYERQGQAITNFKDTLPTPQSELARQVLKNPYNLEFLSVNEEAQERDIEKALVQKLKDFLLELGAGFAFLGNQYHVELEGRDYYMDLLFYHVKLKSYVVIELKNTAFKPEYAGKLNFYLNLVDKRIKDAHDNATIGLLLCKDKGNMTVEYALEGISKPIGVSKYNMTKTIPKELTEKLPELEEFSRRLGSAMKAVGENRNHKREAA